VSPRQSISLLCDDRELQLLIEAQPVIDDPLIGTVLAGHKVMERLGHGGVGIVYRALQLDLQREVALKVLNPESVKRGPAAIEAFKREAIAAGRMSHPNLVQVYAVGEENGVYFFSMEIVEGGDAESHLKNFGAFDEAQALDVICQVAEALQYAASNGLVHRDIKPENLMFAGDGRVKLADLGMSSTRELVGDSAAGGTPHFMPPEAVSDPTLVDQRSDFYSLGCTLFRLLTAATPYQGNSVKEILLQHRDAEIPLLADFISDFSKDSQELIDWLMAKEQDERPQSAAEVIHFCNAALTQQRRSPLIIVLLVVAVAASILFVLQSGDDEIAPEVIDRVIIDETASARADELQKQIEQMQLEAEQQQNSNAVIEAQTDTLQLEEEAATLKAQALLARLNTDVDALMVEFNLSAAVELINSSEVPPAEKLPLLQSCYAKFNAAVIELQSDSARLLETFNFSEAEAANKLLNSKVSAEQIYPYAWQRIFDELHSQSLLAADAHRQTQLLAQRKRFRAQHFLDVCQAILAFDIQAASNGLQNIDLDDAPVMYAASGNHYRQLFAQASSARQKLIQELAADDIYLDDPIDGKRGTVQEVSESGITLLLQVRGERVPRHDNWQLYLKPLQWQLLLESLNIDLSSDKDFQSLSLVLAVSQSSATLRQLATASSEEISAALLNQQRWLTALSSIDFNSVAAQEYSALLQTTSILSEIDSGNNYSALQLLDIFVERFSLLATWSSTGEVAFEENG
jgi:serine/threonine protein kinase